MKPARQISNSNLNGHNGHSLAPAVEQAIQTAKDAGLRYVSDEHTGFTRQKTGTTFHFRNAQGKKISDEATLARVRHLAVPPAWTKVWICPLANGHIQATGRDVRGRKQYRYHEEWRSARDETKYERMIAFGKALPEIRRRVARDLAQRGLGREKVLAAIVSLLEATLIRVGNDEYAKQNHSFGLSTLRDRHVSISRGTLHFEFRGKSGKNHEIDLHDPKLAKIVHRTQDLPGQELFQFVDPDGKPQKISSENVNAYLRSIGGEDFSAKDFRTWAGTVLAARALREFEKFESATQAKKNLLAAIEHVAARLGNTPTICRKCYIHPAILDAYLAGEALDGLRPEPKQANPHARSKLSAQEKAVLKFLQRKLRQPRPSLQEQLKRSLAKKKRPSVRAHGRLTRTSSE